MAHASSIPEVSRKVSLRKVMVADVQLFMAFKNMHIQREVTNLHH
jgi:hypothetical protein